MVLVYFFRLSSLPRNLLKYRFCIFQFCVLTSCITAFHNKCTLSERKVQITLNSSLALKCLIFMTSTHCENPQSECHIEICWILNKIMHAGRLLPTNTLQLVREFSQLVWVQPLTVLLFLCSIMFYHDNNFQRDFNSYKIYQGLHGLFKFRMLKNKDSDFLTAQVIRIGVCIG